LYKEPFPRSLFLNFISIHLSSLKAILCKPKKFFLLSKTLEDVSSFEGTKMLKQDYFLLLVTFVSVFLQMPANSTSKEMLAAERTVMYLRVPPLE
jgi:hypothetical protein